MAPTPSSKSSHYWQQTAQNRILLVVLGMVVLVPLLASPANPTAQNLANVALQLMAALLAVSLILRAKPQLDRAAVKEFFTTGLNLPILLYALASLVCVFVAPSTIRRAGLAEWSRIITGLLLYFALAYHVRRSEHLAKLLDALRVVAGIAAVIGLADIVWQGTGKIGHLFGDPQLFSAFLLMLFPITVVGAVTERDPKRQRVTQIIAALAGLCLFLTGTRSSWYGAITELVALGLLSALSVRDKQRMQARRRQYILPLVVVAVCIGILVAIGNAGWSFAGQSDTTAELYRRRLHQAAWALFKEKPIFGQGLGSYPVLQNHYTSYGRPARLVLAYGPTLAENAHNFWLELMAEQGVVGTALFLAVVLEFLVIGARRLSHMDMGVRRILLLASLAAIAGFIVDAFDNPAWQYGQIAMFFWLNLGIGTACLAQAHRPKPLLRPPNPKN